MIYVGMDISSKSFMVHAVNEKQKEVFKAEIPPYRHGLDTLLADLPQESKVITFEAGNQMKWIAQHLMKKESVKIHVVPPNEVKWITSSSGKTDKVDAKKLALLARADMLPRAVHIVEGHVRELRELISARSLLQSKRVSLINALRGFIKQEGYNLPAKFFGTKHWQLRIRRTKVSEPLKAVIESFISSIEALNQSEKELTEKILKIDDKRLDLLETIPGIGKLASRTLLSALDDVKRFDDQKKVANYGALTPTIYQSGAVTNMGRINRDGRGEIRKVLLQGAHAVTRTSSPGSAPLREFYERIEKRRGSKKAVVALARKLLTTAYGVLKTETPYNPEKLRE